MPETATSLPERIIAAQCDYTPGARPELCVKLPFGLTLCTNRSSAFFFEGADRQLLTFTNFLQPLISPMMMILILAGLVKALADCVKSIPEAIASLSVGPIIDCLEKLAKYLPLLIEFLPPLAYVRTIADIVRVVAALIDSLAESIEKTLLAAQRLIQFDAKIELLPDLSNYRHCVDNELLAQYQQIASALRGTGPLLMVIAKFLELLDIGPLGEIVGPLRDAAVVISSVTPGNLASQEGASDIIAALDDIRSLMNAIEQALAPFGGGSDFPETVDLSGS